MTWSVTIHDGPRMAIADALSASWAWRQLTEKAQTAIAEAWRHDREVTAHPNTMHSLHRHGFITWGQGYTGALTEAGRAVAKWMVRDEGNN